MIPAHSILHYTAKAGIPDAIETVWVPCPSASTARRHFHAPAQVLRPAARGVSGHGDPRCALGRGMSDCCRTQQDRRNHLMRREVGQSRTPSGHPRNRRKSTAVIINSRPTPTAERAELIAQVKQKCDEIAGDKSTALGFFLVHQITKLQPWLASPEGR